MLGTKTLVGSGVASFSTVCAECWEPCDYGGYAGDANSAASASAVLTETVNGTAPVTGGFSVSVSGAATVGVGGAANLQVAVAPQTGYMQPVQLSCADLPSESACTFAAKTIPAGGGTTTLQFSAAAPQACQVAFGSADGESAVWGDCVCGVCCAVYSGETAAGFEGIAGDADCALCDGFVDGVAGLVRIWGLSRGVIRFGWWGLRGECGVDEGSVVVCGVEVNADKCAWATRRIPFGDKARIKQDEHERHDCNGKSKGKSNTGIPPLRSHQR